MRFPTPFFCLLTLALSAAGLRGQDEFSRDFAPTVTFSETRFQNVHYVADFEGYESYYATASSTVTARASMQGVELATIDASTAFSISVGDFTMEGVLGASPTYAAGQKTITFPIDADGDGDADDGNLVIRYSAVEVTFALSVSRDVEAAYSPVAAGLEGSDYAPNEYQGVISGSFAFGGRALSGANIYVTGARVRTYSKTVAAGTDNEEVYDSLADVIVKGASDDKAPAVAFTAPTADVKVNVATQAVTISADDDHEIASVQVQLNGADWEDAEKAAGGGWSFSAELVKGANSFVARATDVDGNQKLTPVRTITFAPLTTLTVNATGNSAGRITAPYFAPLDYTPGVASPIRTATLEEDKALKITATASPNAIFAGWTANVPLTAEQAAAPVLEFALQPGTVLTARFVPNPFLNVSGVFNGLVASMNPSQRGFFTGKLDKKGTFTGSIKIGKLTLGLRGKFSAGGQFAGVVVKGGVSYAVALHLATLQSGTPQLLGTVTGAGLDASVSGDRAEFNAKLSPAPQAGAYNAALSPAPGNTEPNVPVGIGYGRVTVATSGLARFSGVLGDGTRLTFGAHLSKDGLWPFFAALYGKHGSISGAVTFANLAETDLSGAIDWFKPAGLPAQPRFAEGFSGRVEIVGVKSQPVAAGASQRLILPPTGAGVLTLRAPQARLGGIQLPALASDDEVTLSPQTMPTLPVDDRALKFKVSTKTGVFTGSFAESVAGAKKKFELSGVILQPKGAFPGAAAGLFIRGNRTGSVELGAAEE